jgi:hypothetical protein
MELSSEAWHWGSEAWHRINDVRHLVGVIEKPLEILVTLFATSYRILFGAARKFSPAAGLANGYYNNFLAPILRVTDGPTEILLWMSAAENLLDERRRYEDIVAGNNPDLKDYRNCQVSTAQGPRTILLKRPAAAADSRYPALDFPRTLSGLDPDSARGSDLDRLSNLPGSVWLLKLGGEKALQRRELRNFWETLSDLIRKEYFVTRVKVFCGKPENARDEASPITDYSEVFNRASPEPNLLLRMLLRVAGL